MARLVDLHPQDPQPRAVRQVVDRLRDGALIAYPTDSCYALGTRMGDADGLERIRRIRRLDDRHHFTLVCHDFAQLGRYVHVSTSTFRLVKACTPGPYTFILPATREVSRRLMHPRKRTVGVRIPDHPVAQALITELGEPLLSSTLLLPGEPEPPVEAWRIAEDLATQVDVVVDSGECGTVPTTVVDLSEDEPVVVRRGAGNTARFE